MMGFEFELDGFLVTGPVWIIVDRTTAAPDPEPGTTATLTLARCVCGRKGPDRYLTVFTDSDLADRFLLPQERGNRFVPVALETPKSWIRFLDRVEKAGLPFIGFDRGATTSPLHLFRVRKVLRAARQQLR